MNNFGNKYLYLVTLALVLAACDPLDSGDPPTFSSFTATPLSESQVQVTWSTSDVSDDLIEAYNLKYRIWYAKVEDGGLNVESLGTHQVETNAGIIAYTITDLDAETEYEILVRALDLGNYASENTNKKTVTTAAVNGGKFDDPVATALTNDAIKLIAGDAVGNNVEEVCVVRSGGVDVYTVATDAKLTRTTSGVASSNVRDAAFVPVENGKNDHLFVFTDSGTDYYTNNSGLTISDETFASNGAVKRHSFSYRQSNDLLDIFSFVVAGNGVRDEGTGWVYRLSDESDEIFEGFRYSSISNISWMGTGKFNDDAYYDIVFVSGNQIYVDLADDDWNSFSGANSVATIENLSNASEMRLFVGALGSEGLDHILLFVRSASDESTRMISIKSNGDGTFDDAKDSSYSWFAMENPVFKDLGGDGDIDLLGVQTTSNNIAVSPGPSTVFSSLPTWYYGIDGTPESVVVGNLDGSSSNDLAVLDSANSVHVLLSNKQGF